MRPDIRPTTEVPGQYPPIANPAPKREPDLAELSVNDALVLLKKKFVK